MEAFTLVTCNFFFHIPSEKDYKTEFTLWGLTVKINEKREKKIDQFLTAERYETKHPNISHAKKKR